jgi:ribosomal-protein-alanine N-acetyltransferase
MHVPIIETPRLAMRGFVSQDLDRLAEILSDREVMRYMPGGQPFNRERSTKTLNSILEHWEQHRYGWWAVTRRADLTLMGWCGLTYLDETSETEVAYLLDRPYWRQGYATEAARASLDHGFDRLGLETIVGVAFPENKASRRVMEKLGMTYTGTARYFGFDLARYVIDRGAYEGSQGQTSTSR